nr:immunoglobulin light chain junction region [Macaca mulatta]MOX28347.1 immunoglobulin light chain junction region [Macaca mulatta]MOX28406.1 immunoglobulin light chain junction region [Macaca mulatta]MOX28569.1 immunoglobulin light chain junction region [Macaca mulatta]MOX28712.1 immunoglobulin light chain junction region [Macaca mulatta]
DYYCQVWDSGSEWVF